MQQTRDRGIAVLASGVAAAALLLLLVFKVREGADQRPSSGGIDPSAPDSRADDGLARVESATARKDVATGEEFNTTALEGAAVGSEGSAEPENELQERKDEIRLAMESALVGVLDAGPFLDVAQLLTKLEVASSPLPEPDPSGAMCYSLLGTPEGMSAQLNVRRTSNPSFANPLLALTIQLDPPAGSYLVEGALRRGPRATVTIWTDTTGAFKNVAILADFPPDGALGPGFIPLAAQYTYDPESLEWKSTLSGVQNGSRQDQTLPTNLVGRTSPQFGELEQLSSSLNLMYQGLKSN